MKILKFGGASVKDAQGIKNLTKVLEVTGTQKTLIVVSAMGKTTNSLEKVVNNSKTTGEPPLMLAMSVFFAIKDAIASVSNYKKTPELSAPATAEKILLSINKLKNVV